MKVKRIQINCITENVHIIVFCTRTVKILDVCITAGNILIVIIILL